MKRNVTKGHAWLLKQETKDQASFTRAHIPLNIYSIHQLHTVHSHSPHSFLSQQHCPAAPSGKSAAGPSCTALPTFPTGWPSHLGSPNGSKPKWDLQCPANRFFTAENETSSPRNTSNYSILEHEAWRSFDLRKQVVVISQQQSDLQRLLWRKRLCPGAQMPQTSLAALHQRLLWVQQHPRLPQCKPSMVIGAFDCFRDGTNVQIPFNMFIRARQQHFNVRSFCF